MRLAHLSGTPLADALCKGVDVARGHEQWLTGVLETLLPDVSDSATARAVAEARDTRSGQTALHVAARWGYDRPIKALLRAGASPAAVDCEGRSAAHVAAVFGHEALCSRLESEASLVDCWGRTAADILGWQREGLSDRRTKSRTMSSPSGAALLEGDPVLLAAPEVLHVEGVTAYAALLESGRLFIDYVACGKPVVLKGACRGFPADDKWDATALEAAFGDLRLRDTAWWPETVAAGSCDGELRQRPPDLRSYFVHQRSVLGTLARGEVAPAVAPPALHRAPSYFFDTPAHGPSRARLLGDVPLLPEGSEAVRAFVAFARPPQLAVGPAWSGAPAHMHFPALNALVRGRKRWFLFPPPVAFWSIKSPLRCIVEDSSTWSPPSASEGRESVVRTTALEVDQRAGDVVLVPDGWGHLTLSLEPTVSVAYEFVTRCAPLRP